MARIHPQQPAAANLTVDQMQRALPKLDRRIAELEAFDVTTVRRRFDPVPGALEKKVNSTLQDILGHGTVEYNEYTVGSFDTLPLRLGGGNELELTRFDGHRIVHQEGVQDAQTAYPQTAVLGAISSTNDRARSDWAQPQ